MENSDEHPVTRGELKTELGLLRTELKSEIRSEVEAAEMRTLERLERVETTLLTEFRKWARRMETVQKVHSLQIESLTERVTAIEDRLDHDTQH